QGGGQYAACLTAGSPVIVSQDVATPPTLFDLSFDYRFLSTDPACHLIVQLAGEEVESLYAPPTLAADMEWVSVQISDPALQGLNAATLGFTYDGPSGSQVLIDNVKITQLPEPATLSLLALGGLLALRRRREG
ncbi:MAG: PEP-CTERM sorting domain-containing protein, partial [Planctomycetota bacterium]|nr:PEP-CTERM sorting domain-containing protein [Planctomycetota bacterium]